MGRGDGVRNSWRGNREGGKGTGWKDGGKLLSVMGSDALLWGILRLLQCTHIY